MGKIYLSCVRSCPYFEEHKISLSGLKTYQIQEFYNFRVEQCGVSENAIHHYHANISKALKYAVRTERLKSNPAANMEFVLRRNSKNSFL